MCERSKREIKAKEEGRIRLTAAGKPPGARDNPQPPSANIPRGVIMSAMMDV